MSEKKLNTNSPEDEFVLVEYVEDKEEPEEPEVVYIEKEQTEIPFKAFPSVVKKRLMTSTAITAFLNVTFILIFIMVYFSMELLVILLFCDAMLLTDIYYRYYTVKYLQCYCFQGYVVSAEFKGIPGSSTAKKEIVVCNKEETKFLTFNYYGKSKIEKGFPASIYLAKNEQVVMKNDMPYVENIIGATFGMKGNDEQLFDDNEIVNVEDFFISNEK